MTKIALLLAALSVSVASSALADDTVAAKPGKTIVLHDYVVYGRAPRLIAVADVAKLPMQSTLAPLKQPLVQRIEPTVHAAPF